MTTPGNFRISVQRGRLHIRGASTPEDRAYVKAHAFELWQALPPYRRFPKEERVVLPDGRAGVVLQAFQDRLTVWPDGEPLCIFVHPNEAILESLVTGRAA